MSESGPGLRSTPSTVSAPTSPTSSPCSTALPIVSVRRQRPQGGQGANYAGLWFPAVNRHGGFGHCSSKSPIRGCRGQFLRVTRHGTGVEWRVLAAKGNQVEALKHADTDPTSLHPSWPTSPPTRRTTNMPDPRDPSLDPQLVRRGKDEQDAADAGRADHQEDGGRSSRTPARLIAA